MKRLSTLALVVLFVPAWVHAQTEPEAPAPETKKAAPANTEEAAETTASLLAEVLQILQPIHNWFYIEGRPENNDEAP